MFTVGQKVSIPWREYFLGMLSEKRVPNLTGTIKHIDGAYHYVKVDNNPRYDVLELYPNEFEVLENKS